MIYPFAMSSAKTQKALDATSWRDDKTGDWILSIYPEGVIYDCKFWEYTDRNDKSGKLILHNDYDENLSIKFGKEKEGKCSFKIGSDKPRILSRISGTTLPAYPSKDYRNKFVDTGYQSEDSVTISGWVRGLQSEEIEHQGKEIKVYYSPFDPVKSIPAKLDSIGKFSITFPVLNSSRIVIDAKTVGFVFPVEPGKKYFLLIDLKGDKLITMSEDARIQNELLSHIQTVPSFELGKYYYNFIDKSNNWLESMNASIDSLKKAEPTLSDLALSYLQENALASTALSLGNLRINYPAYKFPQHESDYLRDTFFGIMTQPVSLYPIYYYFLMSFVESELLNSDYTLMPKNGASYSIFFIPKKVLENVKTEIDFLNDCIRDGSFNFMFSLPDTIKNTHQRIQDKAKEILNTDGLSPEEEFSYKDLLCRVNVLNDLNASSEIIDVYLMGYYFDQMDHNLAPLSNVVINSLDSLI